MTVGSSLIAMVLAAGSVSIDVEPGTVCVAAPSLSSRLEKAGLRVALDANLRVHVQRDGSRLEVRGRRNGRELQRAFVVRLESCSSAEQLVATLVLAWAQELPAPPRVVTVTPPPAEPPPRADPPPPEEPVAVVEAVPEEAARKVLRPAEPYKPEVAPPPPELPSYLPEFFSSHAALFGGFGAGPTSDVAFTGQGEITAMFGRFGAAFDGGFETTRSASRPVPIQSSQAWLSLSAAAVVTLDERLNLHFALGARVWMITTHAGLADNARGVSLAMPGGVAAAGLSFFLLGPVRLHVRGYFAMRVRAENFEITNYGTALTLQPWQGGLLLGLDWRFL